MDVSLREVSDCGVGASLQLMGVSFHQVALVALSFN